MHRSHESRPPRNHGLRGTPISRLLTVPTR
jgi:hypothetical protein